MTEAPQPPERYQPADPRARAEAQALLRAATHAALAVLSPDTGHPQLSRVALGLGPRGEILSLVSTLSAHSRALALDPRAGLLVGEPGPKGDPLTHPRLSLEVTAQVLPRDDPQHEARRSHWLAAHPKSALYIDFADFRFLRLTPLSGLLVAGFGRAVPLAAADLGPDNLAGA